MKHIFLVLIVGVAALGAMFALCGCEAESATEAEIIVTPASAELEVGRSMVFTASGWDEYRWDLSDESIGTLSRRTGDSVTYTAIAFGGSNSVQTITVAGLGTGGSAGSTNTNVTAVSYFVTGHAIVRHLPKP